MGKQHPPDNNDQRVFGFVGPHERRLRSGRRVPVTAHWRRLPEPQAAPRPEPPRDESPCAAATNITFAITFSATVNVSIAL